MVIKLLSAFLISINIANAFYSSPLLTYKVLKLSENINVETKQLSQKEKDLYNRIISDKESRISDEFKYSKYLFPRVKFWLLVYGFYHRNILVFHEKENLSNILQTKEILMPSGLTKLQERLINFHMQMEESIKLRKKTRINFRVQSGRRHEIQEGLERYQKHYHFHKKYLKAFELPEEIMALGFLESTYKADAVSFVDAAGIWQFMPFLGKTLLPYEKSNDTRFNPFISTLGAFHLLKQNKKILKRWDLAITAYNNGMKAILETKKKLKISLKDMSLKKFVQNNDNLSVGFASSNFYATFSSLVYALAYKELLSTWSPSDYSRDISLYIKNCTASDGEINRELNPQLKRAMRAGDVVVGKKLDQTQFLPLSPHQTRRKYPKNWKTWFQLKCRT